MTLLGGQASWSKMTSSWARLKALACHPTKIVNKEEELTYLSINIENSHTRLFLPLKWKEKKLSRPGRSKGGLVIVLVYAPNPIVKNFLVYLIFLRNC
jgi:hypothetical protein